jgi:hypothetical protein
LLTHPIGQIIGATVTIGNTIADRLQNFALSVKAAAKELVAMARQIKSTTEVLCEIHALYAETEERGMDVSAINTPEIQTLEQNIKCCRAMIESAQNELDQFLTDAPIESTSRSHGNEQIDLDEMTVMNLKGVIREIDLEMTHGKLNLQIKFQAWSIKVFRTYAVIAVHASRTISLTTAQEL